MHGASVGDLIKHGFDLFLCLRLIYLSGVCLAGRYRCSIEWVSCVFELF